MFGLLKLRGRLDHDPAGDLRFRRAITPAASKHHPGCDHRNRNAGFQALFDLVDFRFFTFHKLFFPFSLRFLAGPLSNTVFA